MIDVGDDTKVADVVQIHGEAGSGRGRRAALKYRPLSS
jgi:hypothetical protein